MAKPSEFVDLLGYIQVLEMESAFPNGGRYCLHSENSQNLQAMVIYLPPFDTYPLHKHKACTEFYFVVKGSMRVIYGAESSSPSKHKKVLLGSTEEADTCFLQMPPETWHSVQSLADGVTYLEFKPGPWLKGDTEFK